MKTSSMIHSIFLTSIIICLGIKAKCQDIGAEINVPQSPYPLSEENILFSIAAEGSQFLME